MTGPAHNGSQEEPDDTSIIPPRPQCSATSNICIPQQLLAPALLDPCTRRDMTLRPTHTAMTHHGGVALIQQLDDGQGSLAIARVPRALAEGQELEREGAILCQRCPGAPRGVRGARSQALLQHHRVGGYACVAYKILGAGGAVIRPGRKLDVGCDHWGWNEDQQSIEAEKQVRRCCRRVWEGGIPSA